MQVQKLRLIKGWSQQQLADFSGLSVRTVQRIEAGQPASTETLKSLAAVFEVEFSSLNPEPSMTPATATTPATNPNFSPSEREESEAFRHVRKLRGFYIHLLQYAVIIPALWVINLSTSSHTLWAIWPTLGWGLGLSMHALRLFNPMGWLGPQWERREVEKRLGRPL
jgi:transcriptional regulator with XRE-family HTH domain